MTSRLLLAAALMCATVACEAQHVEMCDSGPSFGNNEVPAAFVVEMSRNSGTFTFDFETRNAKDRVQVRYEGNELFDSGCVGESRSVELTYGPGRSSEIEVVLTPNCSGTKMTSWQFEVGCPKAAIRLTKKPRPTAPFAGSSPRH